MTDLVEDARDRFFLFWHHEAISAYDIHER